jgi:hypothetical protein
VKVAIAVMSIGAIFMVSARGQGFLNLDFESAYNLPGNPGQNGTLVAVTNALPDWVVEGGLTDIYYVSNILSRGQDVELIGGSLALSGTFSAELFGESSISQTALVPGNAESLEFQTYGLSEVSGFSVTLGSQKLLYSFISEGPDYNVYGANIPTDLDGQLEALTLECQGVGSGGVILDDIEFLDTSVPEPAEWALIGVGAILCGLRFRDRQVRRLNR